MRKSTNRVDDVIIARQLMVDAHVTQVAFIDKAKTTNIHTKEHAILATVASNRQPLQLSHHLIHQTIQLPIAARTMHLRS